MEDQAANNRGDGDEDDDDGMNISETKKCYVYGQCQVSRHSPVILSEREYSRIGFSHSRIV